MDLGLILILSFVGYTSLFGVADATIQHIKNKRNK